MKPGTPRQEVLRLIAERGALSAYELADGFNYTLWGAHWRLRDLKEKGLVVNVERGVWALTEKVKREVNP